MIDDILRGRKSTLSKHGGFMKVNSDEIKEDGDGKVSEPFLKQSA